MNANDLRPYNGGFDYQMFVTFVVFAVTVAVILAVSFGVDLWKARRRAREREERKRRRRPF